MGNMISKEPKPTLNYRVVEGINPKDKTTKILRPLITNTETYDVARVLRFAMDNGYITAGQFFSNVGIVIGFFEALQALVKDGRNILIQQWLRIFTVLTGTCDPETRLLGEDNELRVRAQVQSNLRRKASDFSWHCIDDASGRSTVQHIHGVGGNVDKELKVNTKITVSGTNLSYNAETDRITASWQTTDPATGIVTDHSVDLVPESSGYSGMILPFPEGLETAPDGTMVDITFFLRHGEKDVSIIPATAKVKLISR
jgi:hypothetical protein